MIDFTLNLYRKLLGAFIDSGYKIVCFKDYLMSNNQKDKIIILRHDVDKNPVNALKMAKLENKAGIQASYYFRIVKKRYDENIIREIEKLGHEIGYHYENLSEISKEKRGKSKEELYELSIDDFRLNLEKLRKFYPVKTICMHGSPLSKWDNRDLWKRYDYRDFGIIAEPYFDLDFDEVLYLTDTGRRWDGHSFTIRDKVESEYKYNLKSTKRIIEALTNNELPNHIMINVHPQRWDDNMFLWVKELIWQNIKNVGKLFLK